MGFISPGLITHKTPIINVVCLLFLFGALVLNLSNVLDVLYIHYRLILHPV